MAFLSGKSGYVTTDGSTHAGFTNGTLEFGSEVQEINVKSGGGNTTTIEGVGGGSGSIDIITDGSDFVTSSITSGSLVTISFFYDSAGTVEATGSARLGRFSWNINRDGSPQTTTIPFTTHGSWTFPS